MKRPLENLDAHVFVSIADPDGLAEHVPGALRGLLSPESRGRALAAGALYDCLLHQGTRSLAAAPATPFLLELASDPATPERHRILSLLGDLARAPRSEPLTDAPRWFSCMEPLLHHADPRVRSAAAYALAALGEQASVCAPSVLLALRAEDNAVAKASLVLCTGALGADLDVGLGGDADPRVRAAWGLVRAQRGEEPISAQMEDALIQAAALPRESADVLRASSSSTSFPWGGGIWARLAADAIERLFRSRPTCAISVLRRALELRRDRGDAMSPPQTPDLAAMQAMIAAQGIQSPEEIERRAREEVERTPPEIPPDEITEDASLSGLEDLFARLTRTIPADIPEDLLGEVDAARGVLTDLCPRLEEWDELDGEGGISNGLG